MDPFLEGAELESSSNAVKSVLVFNTWSFYRSKPILLMLPPMFRPYFLPLLKGGLLWGKKLAVRVLFRLAVHVTQRERYEDEIKHA